MAEAVFHSIRSQLFLAFFALSLVTAGVGGYGIFGISLAGDIVATTYDRPLMAINFARSASFTFSEMNNALLQRRLGERRDPATGRSPDALTKSFFEDLAVARERSLSARDSEVIDSIADDVRRWTALRQQVGDSPSANQAAELDTLAGQIIDSFDRLVELTAEDGFLEREKSFKSLHSYRTVSILATASALIASVLITLFLARKILRPLSHAATVANRISDGELETKIPAGGRDETGTLLRSMSVMQSNLRQMMEREAQQRRSAQNRLVDAIEGSREGMVLIDAAGELVLVNSQTLRFFPSLETRLEPGTSFAAAFAEAEERPEDTPVELWVDQLDANGELALGDGRWLKISRSVTRDGGLFLFLTDITVLKERESSLSVARQAAEAANKAKSSFLATMGHELRTPLNAVIGFSELMAGEQFGPLGAPCYRDFAADVLASARNLLDIINDVLELAKSADGELDLRCRPINVADALAQSACSVIVKCKQAGLELDMRPPDSLQYVWGEESKLQEILQKLLSNAIKFSRPGGRIRLAARQTENGMAELTVEDTGIGMRPEDIPTALAPFGQIDSELARRYEGVGLGLPLAKALVELHGGRLEIESEPDRGTIVHVRLKSVQPDQIRQVA